MTLRIDPNLLPFYDGDSDDRLLNFFSLTGYCCPVILESPGTSLVIASGTY